MVLLSELQELKSLGGVLYSVQPTLLEADGRCGRCRMAVSQGGSLGPLAVWWSVCWWLELHH